jgi:hypothetical protein
MLGSYKPLDLTSKFILGLVRQAKENCGAVSLAQYELEAYNRIINNE